MNFRPPFSLPLLLIIITNYRYYSAAVTAWFAGVIPIIKTTQRNASHCYPFQNLPKLPKTFQTPLQNLPTFYKKEGRTGNKKVRNRALNVNRRQYLIYIFIKYKNNFSFPKTYCKHSVSVLVNIAFQ